MDQDTAAAFRDLRSRIYSIQASQAQMHDELQKTIKDTSAVVAHFTTMFKNLNNRISKTERRLTRLEDTSE